jgi:soluble cytochrome b562
MKTVTSSPPNREKALRHELESLKSVVRTQQQNLREKEEIISELEEKLKKQQERIEQLEAELKELKKLKGRPKIEASRLNEKKLPSEAGEGKRPGSAKRSKKIGFEVDEEKIIQPEEIPPGAKFNGYRDYDVQELKIEGYNIRFRLAEYITEDGKTIVGQLPREYSQGHYGPNLVGYILYQHYQCRVPQTLIYEQMEEWGIDISTGQINQILTENKEDFHTEQKQVLAAGLETASYVHTDDTGARHQGKNGYCTVIGNQWFAYFRSSGSKSRQNFLETLQGNNPIYVLNDYARSYLELSDLAAKHWQKLQFSSQVLAKEASQWSSYLESLDILTSKARRLVTEAALLGGMMEKGVPEQLRIISDGARQFNVLVHALCWVHAERALRRLPGNTARQRQNIEQMQQLLWDYYSQLQNYRDNPTSESKTELEEGFDAVFGRCYLHHDSLNQVLKGFRDHKAQLLSVLDCPQLPLHNNEAESDIREYVTRRKISGGTRSEAGRRARDTFVGLKKTCRKLGISFWHFLISRLRGDGQIPPLAEVIRARAYALS